MDILLNGIKSRLVSHSVPYTGLSSQKTSSATTSAMTTESQNSESNNKVFKDHNGQPAMSTTDNYTYELDQRKASYKMDQAWNTSFPQARPKRSRMERSAFAVTIILVHVLDQILTTILPQYRYHYFHSLYAKELNKFNLTKECGVELEPDIKAIEDKISDESASWSLYKSYATIVPLVAASVMLGLKSDHIGRRFLFLFPFVTTITENILLAIIIKFNLHFGYTLIGNFISSLSGGSITMSFAGYAMISDTHGKKDDKVNNNKHHEKTEDEELDTTREKSRTIKIVLLDCLKLAPNAIVSLAIGYVIQYAGYFWSIMISVVLKSLLFIYAYLYVTETGEQKKSSGFIAPVKTLLRSVRDPWKRKVLLFVNLGQLFTVYGYVCEREVLKLYQMSPPFCFNSVKIGWYTAESQIRNIFGIPLIMLWRRIGLSDASIAAIGAASESASALTIAAVTKFWEWAFFAAPVIAIPGHLATTITKIVTSRLIGRSALASTFAVMLATEEFFFFAAGLSSNYVYQATLNTVPAASIYLSSAAFGTAMCLYLIQGCITKRGPTQADQEIKVTQNGDQPNENDPQSNGYI